MLKFSVKTDGFDELHESGAYCCGSGAEGYKPVCAVFDRLSRPKDTGGW